MTAWQIQHHGSVSSTSTLALEFIRRQLSAGQSIQRTIILADQQTAGRGQYTRSWHSPAGNLFATYIMPDVPADMRPLLPLYAGVAVWHTLHDLTALIPMLKWPNDIWLHEGKLAGVLVEAVADSGRWIAAIGIGINLNTKKFPSNIEGCSLALATGRQWDARIMALQLAHHLDARRTTQDVLATYRRHDLLKGRKIDVITSEKVVIGTGDGITNTGYLRIATSEGSKEIATGTVRIRKSDFVEKTS